jgi:hypothetical protein
MFAIVKGNLFVSKSGSKNSYTNNLVNAQIYRTREEAKRNCCPENESVINIGYNSILE